jgi:hypothetical protein
MARINKRRGHELGLRECLLEEAVEFRSMYGKHGPEFWDALSKPIDALIAGEAYSFTRYQLPDDHPLRLAAGPAGMCDRLVLTKDDELMPCAQ